MSPNHQSGAASEIEIESQKVQQQFRIAAAVALSILAAGTVFYHYVEQFSWLDSFYFCTITLTTIGYGDLAPKTDVGKLFTVGYVLVGIGIIAYFANILIKHAVIRRELRTIKRNGQ